MYAAVSVAVALVALAGLVLVMALVARLSTPLTVGPTPVPEPLPHGPEVIGTAPARPKTTLHVGQSEDFAISANGRELRYGWTVDGRPAGTGPRWFYAPGAGEVGRRRVEVTVMDRESSVHRAWAVRVLPARPPRIRSAEPAAPTLAVDTGTPVALRLAAEPATNNEHLKTTWTVGSAPAGTGNQITVQPARAGTVVVRAVVTSDLGASVEREWRLAVTAPPQPEPEPPLASLPSEPTPPTPEARAPQPPAESRAAAPPVTARRPDPRGSARTEDIRRWLERYASAWRAHDVQALLDMGQAQNQAEVAALERYFANVSDLDVEVNLIAVRTEGDHAIIRFTRRDRFRDPSGRLLLHESPPIEKELVRTPDGFRIVRSEG